MIATSPEKLNFGCEVANVQFTVGRTVVNLRNHLSGTEVKIFDPRDESTGSGGAELLDSSVAKKGDQWWLYLAGQAHGYGATEIYSASLPAQSPLSATGWKITRDSAGQLQPLAPRVLSGGWDGNGGRHCPSHVRGWDPVKRESVERIYYAGAAENLWGPYTIGFLEWDGEKWIDQLELQPSSPNEDWERGSVYEPNVIYHDGKWKMWYVAGSNQEKITSFHWVLAESEDGLAGWSKHEDFAPPEVKMFDFCVRQRGDSGDSFDAIFSRVGVSGGAAPPETGLWWCRTRTTSSKRLQHGWSDANSIVHDRRRSRLALRAMEAVVPVERAK